MQSHHKKDIYNNVKIKCREDIAFFFVEFPNEYLNWSNDSSIEQKYTTYKELPCRQHWMIMIRINLSVITLVS